MVDQLAFSGAEGYGAETIGGRGGAIVHVTNLSDSGTGSLRWALETLSGPRTVVFDVNGTITLKTQILLSNPNVTIAGQTAPGDGITIEGSRLRIAASDVIVRGLHFRPGDGPGSPPSDRDALFIGATDRVISNVIVDHNSFSWAIDQNVDATGRVTNISISNNIIAQGLSQSLHKDGEHSKGAGAGPWTVTDDPTPDNHISFIKNLLADNFARNPEIGAGDAIEFVNNYVFNYGLGHIGAAFGGSSVATTLRLNAIGNVYEPGLDTTRSTKGPFYLLKLNDGSSIHLADNLITNRPVDADGNQAQSSLYWTPYTSAQYVTTTKSFDSGIDILDSQDVAAYVLANAGAGGGYGLDAVDARLIAAVIDKSSRIVDSVAEAGGVAYNPPSAAAIDTDRDGMPDWFEDLYGFDPALADDALDADGDGYTNVEEYINGLYTGFDLPLARPVTMIAGQAGTGDAFALDPAGGTVAVITGFDHAEGDILDLSGMLAEPALAAAQLYDVVRFNAAGRDTIVSVDPDGPTASGGWRTVAVLRNVRAEGDYALLGLGDAIVRVTGAEQVDGTIGAKIFSIETDRVWLKGHEGDDRILLTGVQPVGAIAGGTGYDSLVVAAGAATSLAGLALDGVERLETLGQTVSATPEQLGAFAAITYSYFAPGLPIALALTQAGVVDLGISTAGRVVALTGSDGADTITMASGADTVWAAAGDDAIYGGDGDDQLFGEGGADLIDAGAGADTLDAGDGDDRLFGGLGRDLLLGGAGNDILDGGVGNDTLRGGAGADIYYVDSSDDAVNERFGQTPDDGAIDLVISTADRVATQFVENITLVGTASIRGVGNDLANVIRGNIGDNLLQGMIGDDTLLSGGGSDTLDGGDGNDTLIAEAAAAGTYTVLTGGAGVDTFKLARSAGATITITDFGNGGDAERIFVDAPYSVDPDDAGNAVLRYADGLTVVLTGIAPRRVVYSADQQALLIKTVVAGVGGTTSTGTSGNDSLAGLATNDRLVGGAGNDKLDGRAGMDLMEGGAGNDTYLVDNIDDVTVELAGEGIDTVQATVDWTLDAYVENLQLAGTAIRATGNALGNILRGNGKDNVIEGKGGIDTLYGGAGSDIFVFGALDATSTDKIADFETGIDKLAFAGSAWGLAPGALDPDYFVVSPKGVTATAAHGQFIADRYHQLYWDADGTGPGKAILIATLGGATISSSDIVIV